MKKRISLLVAVIMLGMSLNLSWTEAPAEAGNDEWLLAYAPVEADAVLPDAVSSEAVYMPVAASGETMAAPEAPAEAAAAPIPEAVWAAPEVEIVVDNLGVVADGNQFRMKAEYEGTYNVLWQATDLNKPEAARTWEKIGTGSEIVLVANLYMNYLDYRAVLLDANGTAVSEAVTHLTVTQAYTAPVVENVPVQSYEAPVPVEAEAPAEMPVEAAAEYVPAAYEAAPETVQEAAAPAPVQETVQAPAQSEAQSQAQNQAAEPAKETEHHHTRWYTPPEEVTVPATEAAAEEEKTVATIYVGDQVPETAKKTVKEETEEPVEAEAPETESVPETFQLTYFISYASTQPVEEPDAPVAAEAEIPDAPEIGLHVEAEDDTVPDYVVEDTEVPVVEAGMVAVKEDERSVVIESSCGTTIMDGEIIELTARMKGFESCKEMLIIWEANKTGEWEEVARGTDNTFEYAANEENIHWEFRVRVLYR